LLYLAVALQVLKLLLDPEDWNAEIRGYNNSNSNPAVVKVIALMSLPAGEVNKLCQNIKGYMVRPDFEKVPVMVFEKWAGSLREAIDGSKTHYSHNHHHCCHHYHFYHPLLVPMHTRAHTQAARSVSGVCSRRWGS
jgi:hypothetical protein